MSSMKERINNAYKSISSKIPFVPEIGIVLGSGLGGLLDSVKIDAIIPYKEIKDFPQSTAPSHKGQFVFVHIGDIPCVLMQGRIHFYEGYEADEVVIPQRLMIKMGVKTIILTNAAGGMQEGMKAGDIMLITDHISTLIPSPVRGENLDEFGVRFPDMTDIYTKELRKLAEDVAKKEKISLKKGVYFQHPGPQFETPAEIKMYRALGGDVCGMSTAIEAVAIRHAGIKLLGFSLITNLAAGLSKVELDGNDVIDVANEVGPVFTRYIMALIKALGSKK